MTKYSYATLGSSTSMLADKCFHIYIPLTNQRNLWRRVTLEKLTGARLVNK